MSAFLIYNPFYHFLELVRAPLLGHQIAPLSWLVVLSISLLGVILAWVFRQHFTRHIALWI